MGLADRDYMKKGYGAEQRDEKSSREPKRDKTMPSYRVYRFRIVMRELKEKLRRLVRKSR